MSKSRLFFIVFSSSARVSDTNLVMLPTFLQSTPDQETLIKKVNRKVFLLIKLHADVRDYAIWVLLSDVLLTLNFSSVTLSHGFRMMHSCFPYGLSLSLSLF